MTAVQNSISIVMPALNEERHLEQAVSYLLPALEKHFDDYEILIFNDGSTDRTGEVADRLAEQNERICAFHHQTPQNIGGVIHAGLQKATKHWFMWVDGKGATTTEALDAIFSHRHLADVVVPYTINEYDRSLPRRLLHVLYCAILNVSFRLDLKAYNHLALCRREDAKRFAIRTRSYGYQSEQLIKLLKSGATYVQVGVYDRFDNEGRKTKAFKIRNILGIMRFYLGVLYDIYIRRVARPRRASKMIDRLQQDDVSAADQQQSATDAPESAQASKTIK